MYGTPQERVAKGVALLDEVKPGWASKVVVNRLNLESPLSCILGQVYGNFRIGAEVLGWNWDADDRIVPISHGVLALEDKTKPFFVDLVDLITLETEWTIAVLDRQVAGDSFEQTLLFGMLVSV